MQPDITRLYRPSSGVIVASSLECLRRVASQRGLMQPRLPIAMQPESVKLTITFMAIVKGQLCPLPFGLRLWARLSSCRGSSGLAFCRRSFADVMAWLTSWSTSSSNDGSRFPDIGIRFPPPARKRGSQFAPCSLIDHSDPVSQRPHHQETRRRQGLHRRADGHDQIQALCPADRPERRGDRGHPRHRPRAP